VVDTPDFRTVPGPSGRVRDIALQSDGRIVVVAEGVLEMNNQTVAEGFLVVRFNADGTVDSGFGNSALQAPARSPRTFEYSVRAADHSRVTCSATPATTISRSTLRFRLVSSSAALGSMAAEGATPVTSRGQ
jgi:hypothetical protein